MSTFKIRAKDLVRVDVAQWSKDQHSQPSAVVVNMLYKDGRRVSLPLLSRDDVAELVTELQTHADQVWPAPRKGWLGLPW